MVVLLGTLGMAPLLKTNFFDAGDQAVLTVKQELTPGTGLAATDAQARKAEQLLAGIDGVKDYQVTIGSSGFMAAFGGATSSNQASYQVMLDDSASYDAVEQRITDGVHALKGIGTTTVSAGAGFGSQDLSVVVKAADAKVLRTASEQVRKAVASLDDVGDRRGVRTAGRPAARRAGGPVRVTSAYRASGVRGRAPTAGPASAPGPAWRSARSPRRPGSG